MAQGVRQAGVPTALGEPPTRRTPGSVARPARPRGSPPHFREPADLLVVLGQRNLVQGRYDLFAQQLDGAHDGLRVHGPLIPVDVQIAGVKALDHLGQLPDDGLGRADNDIIDRLELLVGHPYPQTAGPRDVAGGTLRLHADGFTGLVAGWVVVLAWAPLAVA